MTNVRTFAVFLLVITLTAAPAFSKPVPTSSFASCENVPLSFASTDPLLASRNRKDVGTVSSTLSGGELSVTVQLNSGCVLGDDLHVNLVGIDSALGTTSNVAPGRFPCKTPASGTTQTLTCDIGLFPIPDCCADTFRLFVHAVVDCQGQVDTAYGGNGRCTTAQWCNYQDVAVSIDCPLCNECSTSDAACIPITDGSKPSGCDGEICKDGNPAFESCEAGACTETLLEPCAECNICTEATGKCDPIADGETDGTCNGTPCFNEKSTGAKQCMEGECKLVKVSSCEDCNECGGDSQTCMPVENGTNDGSCTGDKCFSATETGTQQCVDGSCETVMVGTCSECNSCGGDSQTCTPVADGTTDATCGGPVCVSSTQAGRRECESGTCVDVPGTECGECNNCNGGVCAFDSDSIDQDVCVTCREQCTLAEGETTGGCVLNPCLPTEDCVVGAIDKEDMCVSQTCPQVPCGTNEDCIGGVCVPSGDCSQSKVSLCDAILQFLGQTTANAGKCCPDTSGCVKNSLGLSMSSVCSTNCGGCDLDETWQTSPEVREVYCYFGTNPSTVDVTVPACTDIDLTT